MTKQEKAQKILMESGWINNYYYIIKVMESCLKITDIGMANLQLIKTFSWGRRQLENKLEILRDRNPKCSQHILEETNDYVNFLWNMKYKIQDRINHKEE